MLPVSLSIDHRPGAQRVAANIETIAVYFEKIYAARGEWLASVVTIHYLFALPVHHDGRDVNIPRFEIKCPPVSGLCVEFEIVCIVQTFHFPMNHLTEGNQL